MNVKREGGDLERGAYGPTLFFNDREMDPEPRNGPKLTLVAAMLDAGETVHVELQPGDGTRYELLLVPLWAEPLKGLRTGWSPDDWREVIYAFNAIEHSDVGGCAVQRGGHYADVWRTLAKGSDWTAKLVEWWFEQHLWPRIAVIRGVGR